MEHGAWSIYSIYLLKWCESLEHFVVILMHGYIPPSILMTSKDLYYLSVHTLLLMNFLWETFVLS